MDMNLLIRNNDKMNTNLLTTRMILFASYFLNIPVWMGHFPLWAKWAILWLSGLTTIMAFLNQWISFKKNYKTFWLIITINHIFTFIKPKPRQKKNRHYKRSLITKPTNQDEPLH